MLYEALLLVLVALVAYTCDKKLKWLPPAGVIFGLSSEPSTLVQPYCSPEATTWFYSTLTAALSASWIAGQRLEDTITRSPFLRSYWPQLLVVAAGLVLLALATACASLLVAWRATLGVAVQQQAAAAAALVRERQEPPAVAPAHQAPQTAAAQPHAVAVRAAPAAAAADNQEAHHPVQDCQHLSARVAQHGPGFLNCLQLQQDLGVNPELRSALQANNLQATYEHLSASAIAAICNRPEVAYCVDQRVVKSSNPQYLDKVQRQAVAVCLTLLFSMLPQQADSLCGMAEPFVGGSFKDDWYSLLNAHRQMRNTELLQLVDSALGEEQSGLFF